jgi:2,4-dienoyl-CoA reductase-like NADH-dependent reductase (Old Yellow Enzyme family)
MSALFTPFKLRSVAVPNRIVVSPMCQYSADRGEASAWHLMHLGSLALSGAGMLCIEATAVEPDGRITPACLGLWDQRTEAALQPVLAAVRRAFVDAATRAARLGLDAIEIHSAHGYLLHEFLSPIANQRTDQYGGALENRLRFPLEVFEAVRAAFPADKPVGVKVSATDWVDGGWDLAQTIAYSRELHKRGADWVAASSGGLSPLQKIPIAPGYQVPFAQAVKQASGINTMAVGLITEPQQAEDIVASGKADLIALARAMLYDPRWPWHAAAQLHATVSAPPQYWRSQPQGLKNLFGDVASGQR